MPKMMKFLKKSKKHNDEDSVYSDTQSSPTMTNSPRDLVDLSSPTGRSNKIGDDGGCLTPDHDLVVLRGDSSFDEDDVLKKKKKRYGFKVPKALKNVGKSNKSTKDSISVISLPQQQQRAGSESVVVAPELERLRIENRILTSNKVELSDFLDARTRTLRDLEQARAFDHEEHNKEVVILKNEIRLLTDALKNKKPEPVGGPEEEEEAATTSLRNKVLDLEMINKELGVKIKLFEDNLTNNGVVHELQNRIELLQEEIGGLYTELSQATKVNEDLLVVSDERLKGSQEEKKLKAVIERELELKANKLTETLSKVTWLENQLQDQMVVWQKAMFEQKETSEGIIAALKLDHEEPTSEYSNTLQQLSVLQIARQEWVQQESQLKQQLLDLRSSLLAKTQQEEALNSKFVQLTSDYHVLESQAAFAKSEVLITKGDLSIAKDKAEQRQNDLNLFRKRISDMEGEFNNFKSDSSDKINLLKTEKKVADGELNDLKKTLEESKVNMNRLNLVIEEERRLNEEKRARISEITESASKQSYRVDSLSGELEKQQHQNKKLNESISALNVELSENLEKLEKLKIAKNDKVGKLEMEIEESQDTIKKQTTEIYNLKQSIKNLENEKSSAEESLAILKRQVKTLTAESTSVTERERDLERSFVEAESSNGLLKVRLLALEEKSKYFETEANDLRTSLQKIKEEHLLECKKIRSSDADDKERTIDELDNLRKTNKKLLNSNEALETSTQRFKTILAENEDQITCLKSQLKLQQSGSNDPAAASDSAGEVATVLSNVILRSGDLPVTCRTKESAAQQVVTLLRSRLVSCVFDGGASAVMLPLTLFGRKLGRSELSERPLVSRVIKRVNNLWDLAEDIRLGLVQCDPSLSELYQKSHIQGSWMEALDTLSSAAKVIEERNLALEKKASDATYMLKESRAKSMIEKEKLRSMISGLKRQLSYNNNAIYCMDNNIEGEDLSKLRITPMASSVAKTQLPLDQSRSSWVPTARQELTPFNYRRANDVMDEGDLTRLGDMPTPIHSASQTRWH